MKVNLDGVLGALVCPGCGCDNLHQVVVATHCRGEDAVTKTSAVDNRTGEIFSHWGIQNPSSRRQGVSIQFVCEHCDDFPVLHVYQNKGTTYVEWDNGSAFDRATNLARCMAF